jgi:phage terminase small subunit
MPIAKITHKQALDTVGNPKIEKKITKMQEEFARIYACEELNQTEAALKAGYSPKSAPAIASQLLNGKRFPMVVERIREIKQEIGRKYEVTFDGHVRKLAEIRDAALTSGNFNAAVAAEKSRGQAAGLYIDRKEILHGRIEQMTREDVMREITRLQDEFPALSAVTDNNVVIDIDPVNNTIN